MVLRKPMRSQVEELLMQRTLCWESRDLAPIPGIPLTPGVLPCLGMTRVLSKSDHKPPPPAWCTRRCFHVGVHLTGLHLLFPPWILQKCVPAPVDSAFLLEVLPPGSSECGRHAHLTQSFLCSLTGQMSGFCSIISHWPTSFRQDLSSKPCQQEGSIHPAS